VWRKEAPDHVLVIVIASISDVFLDTPRSILAPFALPVHAAPEA
jgi:hypothetical protein